MARFQEARWEGSPYSSGVEVSELADEGEQGPIPRAKRKCLSVKE